MPRSASLHPDHKETARFALERNGLLTQGDLKKLKSHPYWIQIDSLERLLNPEQPTGFFDTDWVTFLRSYLTTKCQTLMQELENRA
jgi:hypothetical protein